MNTSEFKLRSRKHFFVNICVFFLASMLTFAVTNMAESSFGGKTNMPDQELTTYRNKYNQEVAKNNVLVADYRELKNSNSILSEQVTELSNLLDRKTVSATILKVESRDTITVPIETIKYIDSLPVYTYTHATEFDSISVSAGPDSMNLSYRIRNEYQIEQSLKSHLFKRDEISIEVKSINPNSYTTGLTSFHIPLKNSKIFIGIGIGAASATALLLLTQ